MTNVLSQRFFYFQSNAPAHMITLYLAPDSAENESADKLTHFNNGGHMDTGYPALIPEPLHNRIVKKPFTIPSETNQDDPPSTDTQTNLTGSQPTSEKVS